MVGTIRPLNILELAPHWDKIIFGIELSLIGILFRHLPLNKKKLWQRSRVSWLTKSTRHKPISPLQPDTPRRRCCWSSKFKVKVSFIDIALSAELNFNYAYYIVRPEFMLHHEMSLKPNIYCSLHILGRQ